MRRKGEMIGKLGKSFWGVFSGGCGGSGVRRGLTKKQGSGNRGQGSEKQTAAGTTGVFAVGERAGLAAERACIGTNPPETLKPNLGCVIWAVDNNRRHSDANLVMNRLPSRTYQPGVRSCGSLHRICSRHQTLSASAEQPKAHLWV